MAIRLTRQAAADVEQAWQSIAVENVAAAHGFNTCFYEAVMNLAEMPKMGSERRDLTFEPVRFWLLQDYGYFVVYAENGDDLVVVRVLSTFQDIRRLGRLSP